MDEENFSESGILWDQQLSADEVASLIKDSESTQKDVLSEFSSYIEKISPLLNEMKDEKKFIGTPLIQKAIESLETDFQRAKAFTSSPNLQLSPAKHVEDVTQNLGRSLGLVLFAGRDLSVDDKEKIEGLRRKMMDVRFNLDSERESESTYDADTEEETEITEEPAEDEIMEEKILDMEDVLFQLKYGNDEKFGCALSRLDEMISNCAETNEMIGHEDLIAALFSRLSSSKSNYRLATIRTLRSLIEHNNEDKEKMAELGSLSILVKSLMREEEERGEAVGLLLSLSEVPAVKRRIGRIQGCIVALVAILNGDDQVASQSSGKLLNALSGNTQYALHMAEAGYFRPLVQYLKEGSDMSKILMATALSRMELTDQTRASLGEDGAVEPLVKMFKTGNLESKLSSLNALRNLSLLRENVCRLINSGIVVTLLQLLFSVTSVLMTLREPASAILARIAQSENILVKPDVAQQMLSLLNLSSPAIQYHLLEALNSIDVHSNARKAIKKMNENGAIQLLLPFIMESNTMIRTNAMKLIYILSKDLQGDLTEQLSETYINALASLVSSSACNDERTAAVGVLSNLAVSKKKATDILVHLNLLPILISLISLNPEILEPATTLLTESIAGILIRFTVSSDRKLQHYSAEHGVIPVLVKLLSSNSVVAKSRAATCLAQLSQNTISLSKEKKSRWFCVPPSPDAYCEVHDGHCSVRSTFCLVKAVAISPLVKILEGSEREADEAVLSCLGTLLEDEIWENGSNFIAKMSGIQAIVRILQSGSKRSQEKALWMLERIFRIEVHRVQHGEYAQAVLIDLAQTREPELKRSVARLLAQLELLQAQSSYF